MFELSEIKERVLWQEAMDYAAELGDGWRVPERWELDLMYEAKRLGHPMFQDMLDSFFSSATCVGNIYQAWYVDFYYGYINYCSKSDTIYARCVRGSLIDLHQWVEDQKGKNAK